MTYWTFILITRPKCGAKINLNMVKVNLDNYSEQKHLKHIPIISKKVEIITIPNDINNK